MEQDVIRVETDSRGVATITLNRPGRHNAMSAAMMDALAAAAARLGADPGLRAVVLTGAGESFCAGGDLGWMMAQIQADRAQRMAEARRLAGMLRALNEMPKPLIGRIQGNAYGGGLGLIAVCDIAVAAAEVRLAFTETRLGLIPATIGPYVAARMGEGKARRVFMSARPFDAAEAVALDLLARAVPAAELDAAVEAELAPFLRVAPGAVGRAKALLRSLGARIDDQVIEATIGRLADSWETEEARAGIAAFLDKRPPPWA
ncbi:MAG: methylglutaconyl-CoA hydratase [Paracoccaceae bacterium]|nr:MAG: methylglutaconyl-CoA hydratase [Paracoccaceae bacterium]